MRRAAVFLDRDGVLNRALVREGRPYAPSTAEEVELEPGAAEACAELARAGYVLVVVTNQPELSRGGLTIDESDRINERVASATAVDEVRVCPHDDADRCACRKPAPGMLLDAARDHDLDLDRSWMVGDRWRDVQAGQSAGVRAVFIDRGWKERRPEPPFEVAADLPNAVAAILAADSAGRSTGGSASGEPPT